LDDGWAPGHRRYADGPDRYKDLRSQDDVLVMELGCGEPTDFSFRGATRNPGEWLQVLRDEHRQLHAVLLWGEWDAVERRAQRRGTIGMLTVRMWYGLYAGRDEIVTFPAGAGIVETVIDTTSLTPEQVAAEIRRQVPGLGDGNPVT
jgi:hypothetical protein